MSKCPLSTISSSAEYKTVDEKLLSFSFIFLAFDSNSISYFVRACLPLISSKIPSALFIQPTHFAKLTNLQACAAICAWHNIYLLLITFFSL
jgi:hypothetical protein